MHPITSGSSAARRRALIDRWRYSTTSERDDELTRTRLTSGSAITASSSRWANLASWASRGMLRRSRPGT